MKSDLEPSDLEYYLTLDEWGEDFVKVKVNFAEPLLVSKGLTRDSVVVDIKEPSLFRSKMSGEVVPTKKMSQEFPS